MHYWFETCNFDTELEGHIIRVPMVISTIYILSKVQNVCALKFHCLVIDLSHFSQDETLLVIICNTAGTFHGTPQGVSKGPGSIIAEVSTLLAEEVERGSHEVVRLL